MCPVCGSLSLVSAWEDDRFSYYACSSCGHTLSLTKGVKPL
jgi:Zn ribbon nucleic-acid-binding protein